MKTPLYDALQAYANQTPLRFHMPGHKGRPIPAASGTALTTALDLTELPPTGNLYCGGDVIAQAEALWAQTWGMPYCQFLTGGSTQGIHAAFLAACLPGEEVLVDRASHRAVHTAMALCDLHPHYLLRDGLTPISPTTVENFLESHPNVKTFCMVSPTYYGVLSDVPAISAVVHAHGGTLIVDAAHGAHLPFLGDNPFLGADLVVSSAHKTLRALGQGALLFSGGKFSEERLRSAAAITGTSSPSYLVLASLDLARAHMMGQGREDYAAACSQVAALRKTFPSLCSEGLDPARFVLLCGDGFAAERGLHARNCYPELADSGHVVFICTDADKPEDFTALTVVLRAVLSERDASAGMRPTLTLPDLPLQALSPRSALFAPKETVSLADAEGRVCARSVAPYPPGVPILAPGEGISKKHLAYLWKIGYNREDKIEVVL